jgi:hypothetical protein
MSELTEEMRAYVTQVYSKRAAELLGQGADEIDRLSGELAGQRARAEAAERERDVARRLAQQEYHHRMRAEQAVSPPPAGAPPSTLAAELREWAGALEDGDYSPEYIGLLRWAADAIERLEAVARAARPAAPAADPDAPEPWTPGIGERVQHKAKREIGIVESGPHPGVFDPGPFLDVRVGVFRTTWDVANIEPAPATPDGPEEGAVRPA